MIPHERVIICVDMDAFFASVEQRVNPALRGKPIAVVGPGGRTVVTTASYEARALGVKTGMNIYEAKRACPWLILVKGNNARYTHTCRVLSGLYSRFTPDVEIYSVDEAFLDVTTTHHLFGGPADIGRMIKRGVSKAFGIKCTVGIGPNILIAKLASDISKPDGLRWIRQSDAAHAIAGLDVEELWGIGRKTAKRLAALGIRTCGELAKAPKGLLRNKFGILGETLGGMGGGILNRPAVADEPEPKSIGHSFTLPADIDDMHEAEAHLLKLSEMVGRRARRFQMLGGCATLVVRYSDFETVSRQSALRMPTSHTHAIHQSAVAMLKELNDGRKIRLLGITLSHLINDDGQLPLMPETRREAALLTAMDRINDKYGERKISWAAYLKNSKRGGDVISPSWRPSGPREFET